MDGNCSFSGCREDDSYKPEQPDPSTPGKLSLTLTTRVGTKVGDPLTDYVKSLDLLLFRAGETGSYVLYRDGVLNKQQLEALERGRRSGGWFHHVEGIYF